MNITELCVNCKKNNSCTMCWKTSKKKCPHFVQKTNADRIRSMTDEELAEFIRSMVDGSYNYDFACYKYTNYVTHHSDPANKGIYLYKCDDCESEGIGLDVLMWLQQPAEEEAGNETD